MGTDGMEKTTGTGASSRGAAGARGAARQSLAPRANRRALLRAGGLGLLAGPAGVARLLAAPENPGKAKACIFLFMWGGPSQLDTWDMKPGAAAEVRGEFQPRATRTPGLQICEHFQRVAKHSEHLAVVRSLSHDDPAHLSSAHAMLTGSLAPVVRSDRDPPSDRDTPHLGAMVSHLRDHRQVPGSVIVPWKCYHPAAPGGQAPGQHGGWLGPQYAPLLIEGDLNSPAWQPPALSLPDGISPDRLAGRNHLLAAMDRQRQELEQAAAGAAWGMHQQGAVDLLLSPRVARAFDLSREPDAIRERYGRNLHGQAVLLARRLVEHGVPVVNVNWHNDGKNFWDTHGNNFNRLKNDLIPPADQALAALLEDLQQRGLLEQTLVAWVGEFGRRPQITQGNAGREHWPHCFSGVLAGGGIQGGAVYGESDRLAAYPHSQPASPHDFLATILHALGCPPDQTLVGRDGRPRRVCPGTPLPLLG